MHRLRQYCPNSVNCLPFPGIFSHRNPYQILLVFSWLTCALLNRHQLLTVVLQNEPASILYTVAKISIVVRQGITDW